MFISIGSVVLLQQKCLANVPILFEFLDAETSNSYSLMIHAIMANNDSSTRFSCFLRWRTKLDKHSFKWMSLSYFWTHKNLLFFTSDVIFDGLQAKRHFDNNNFSWGALTVLLMIFPNIASFLDIVLKRKGNWVTRAVSRLMFLHLITLYR